jgi:hypothetical protein
MAIPSRQIGWGTESNLLWQILKQLSRLTSTLFSLKEAATPKYKVYTALLTQSGGDVPNTTYGDESLLLGVSYTITANPDNDDLTPYGAPNSNVGTSFVSTSDGVALPYTTSLELSTNGGAPVATVLENTIGNIWFTYDGVGVYLANSNSLFTENKTFVFFGSEYNSDNYDGISVLTQTKVIDLIRFKTPINPNGSTLDDNLFYTSIEIRVYN